MLNDVPMITTRSLATMPQFVQSELGEHALRSAFDCSGLPYRFLDQRDGFIPEKALARFISCVGGELGVTKVGLLWFGRLTVADYGAWGGYVLSAPNLRVALERAAAIISLHATHDRALFRVAREGADFVYRFGLDCGEDYENIAYSAIAVIASIPHFYVGAQWRPQVVHVDLPRPAFSSHVEDVLGCPVMFGAPELVVRFCSADLSAGHGKGIRRVYSFQDVKRERISGPPRSFVEQVGSVIRMHMKDDHATAEMTAMTLGLSLRGLQARLNQEGLTHRQLLKEIRLGRAKELLVLRELSIIEIASQLGYSVPNNFTRYFGSMTGMSPREYRRSLERHCDHAAT